MSGEVVRVVKRTLLRRGEERKGDALSGTTAEKGG